MGEKRRRIRMPYAGAAQGASFGRLRLHAAGMIAVMPGHGVRVPLQAPSTVQLLPRPCVKLQVNRAGYLNIDMRTSELAEHRQTKATNLQFCFRWHRECFRWHRECYRWHRECFRWLQVAAGFFGERSARHQVAKKSPHVEGVAGGRRGGEELLEGEGLALRVKPGAVGG